MQIQVTEPDVASIVEGTISGMLGLDPGQLIPAAEHTTCAVAATVQFTGDWSGALVVACDAGLGREAAAAMFGTEADQVQPDELSDAIGELANMIAGNVKPLLSGTAALSLPTVVHGSEVVVEVPGTEPVVRLLYRRESAELAVAILKRVE